MRLSIKAKQVAGVTTIVALAVVVLSGVYLSSLARVLLEASRGRGDLLAGAIYQRARTVVDENAEGRDPEEALRTDSGLRTILQSSAYDKRVTYAAIVDVEDIAIGLTDKFPEVDPYTVRFTDMHKWITELPGFAGDPMKSNESKLEAIQMAWHEEWEDRKG